MEQVIILSGPPGARKTKVAEALCERFDRMVHVEVNDLRQAVKAGYRRPWEEDRQAREQHLLARRNACAIARESIALRYAVVITDVVTADAIPQYRDALAGIGAAVQLVTLLPSLEVTLASDAAREQSIDKRIRMLHAELSRDTASGAIPGAVLDTTNDPDPRATGDRVQDVVARGQAGFVAG